MKHLNRIPARVLTVFAAIVAPMCLTVAPASATIYSNCSGSAIRFCVSFGTSDGYHSASASIRDVTGGTNYDVDVLNALYQERPCGTTTWGRGYGFTETDGWHDVSDIAPENMGGADPNRAGYQYRAYTDARWRVHGSTTVYAKRFFSPVKSFC